MNKAFKIAEIKADLVKAVARGKDDFADFAEFFTKKCNVEHLAKAYYMPFYEPDCKLPTYTEDLKTRTSIEDLYLNGNDSDVERAEWLENFFCDIMNDIQLKIAELKADLEIFEGLADKAESIKWSAEIIRDLTDELQEAENEEEEA